MNNGCLKWWQSKEVTDLLKDLELEMVTDRTAVSASDFRLIRFQDKGVVIKTGDTETKHPEVVDVDTLFVACENHVAVLVIDRIETAGEGMMLN